MLAAHSDSEAPPTRRRVARFATAVVLLGGLVLTALVNRGYLERVVYTRTLERDLLKTEDAVLHWGSPQARLKVRAYLPLDCLCQGDRIRVLSEASRQYGDRIYIELVNIDSRLGARQFAHAGLSCSGIFVNGRQRLTVVVNGNARPVYLSGAPAEESPGREHYTAEELKAAIAQEAARLLGPDAVARPATSATLPLPLPKSPTAQAAANAREPDLDAQAFDDLAKTLFAPVYPLLAKQIVNDYHVTTGRCLDVGCGPAYLSIELAKATRLTITALDVDRRALAIARENVAQAGLKGRVVPVEGDVQALTFGPDRFDLVVSRCSLPCWKDKVKAFQEINRVLKPGGVAFIGVGSGRLLSETERRRIVAALDKLRRREGESVPWLKSLPSTRFLQYCVLKAGLPDAKITRTSDGVWVEFRKETGRS